MLWYSEADQKRWRAYSKKHDLDPNINVRAEKRRMERINKKTYLLRSTPVRQLSLATGW
jgi:hypothetical protein